MTPSEAEAIVKAHVKGEFLLKHMIATSAIMSAAAQELREDRDAWSICGLLHDIDFEETKDNPAQHGVVAQRIIGGKVDEKMLRAIASHNEMIPDAPQRDSKMEHMLVAADAMTGLIIACAMVKGKKLSNVTEDTVKKAFRKKGFAQGSRREMITECEKAGISYERFVALSLKAMQDIASTLSL